MKAHTKYNQKQKRERKETGTVREANPERETQRTYTWE